MASLALGIAGGLAFGPAGFLAGQLIGNLLFPTKNDPGPGNAPKIQGSTYGQMIPIPYGTIRIWAPQVVWQDKWTSHKHSTGGKGGPTTVTYTWSTSFAIKLCKGPIAGVLKIWANGELIYDITPTSTTDNSQVPATFYNGVESDSPDPTMEAALGVGKVPAFRDDAAIVFTNWDCGNFGNTLPQLSVLVFAQGGPIPWRVNTIDSPTTTQWWNTTSLPTDRRNGAYYDPATQHIFAFTYSDIDQRYSEREWSSCFETGVTPTDEGQTGPTDCDNVPGDGTPRSQGPSTITNAPVMWGYGRGDPDLATWYYKTTAVGAVMDEHAAANPGPGGSHASDAVWGVGVYQNDFIYAPWANTTTGAVGIARWPAPSMMPTGLFDAVYTLTGSSSTVFKLATDSSGDIWVAKPHSGSGDDLWWFAPDLTLKYCWDQSDAAHSTPSDFKLSATLVVYNGYIASMTGAGVITSKIFDVWKVSASDHSITAVGNLQPTYGGSSERMLHGFVLVPDGIVSLDPPVEPVTLASIVSDQSVRAGLSTGDIDVTQLTDLVDGYICLQQQDCRSNIDPLRSAYFFDAVEQTQAVFVKRGQLPAVTIPDNDLAAQEPGQTPPALVQIKRLDTVSLPAVLDVTYYNLGAAYQDGTQQAVLQTTDSQATATINLPIAMTDAKARQIAVVLIRSAWIERMAAVFMTSRKYDYLEPTDVVTAHGYIIRITKKTEKVVGILEFEGVLSIPAIYTIGPVGNATSGGGQPSSTPIQPTDLLLLDIPLLIDTDSTLGGDTEYAAMAGHVDNTWRGATLFISADSGTTYANVATAAVAAAMGVTVDALGNWTGGNVFDISNLVTLTVGVGGGELVSASESAVLSGANMILIGNELVQPQNATLTAPSTYVLDTMLRGRRGTEWAMASHAPGEVWALPPFDIVPLTMADLGQPRLYKPVTFGDTLANTLPTTFTNNGIALRPYSPVQLYGAPITPFDGTVQMFWQRRTRIGGAWVDFTDVPLSEPTETYIVQIWDATYTLCARIITVTGAQNCTYSAADQTTDFGATQQHIYATVGQLGSYQLGVQSPVVVPGLGGSDNAPLNPIPPYNTTPPPTVPPGCALPVTSSSFVWAVPVSQYDPTAGPAETWVLSFTTGAAVAGAGSIQAAEFSGPAVTRDAVLSTSPCGAPLTIGAHSTGTTVQVIFYMLANPFPSIYPTLLPSTTYYFSINSVSASGMICNLSTPH